MRDRPLADPVSMTRATESDAGSSRGCGCWGCLTALEILGAVLALPIGVAMLALGDSDGWWVVGVATALLVAFFVEWAVTGRIRGPWL